MFRWLARKLVEHVEAMFVQPGPDGKAVLTDRAKAMVATLAPQALDVALRSFKAPKGEKAPVYGPTGQLDMNALIGLVPREYRGIAAIALPFLGPLLSKYLRERGVGGGELGSQTQTTPFLKR